MLLRVSEASVGVRFCVHTHVTMVHYGQKYLANITKEKLMCFTTTRKVILIIIVHLKLVLIGNWLLIQSLK